MNKIVYAIIWFVSGMACAVLCTKNKIPGKIVVNTTDTVTVVKIDTLTRYMPEYIERRTVDTVYADSERLVPMPIEQVRYGEKGRYDLWLSGFSPRLDSIKVYNSVSHTVVSNTAYVTKYRWRIYPYLGLNAFSGNVSPAVGISFSSPKRWIYNAEIGSTGGNSRYIGIRVGMNILGNN